MTATNLNTGVALYPMATLYVGDLHQDVTEAMLFDKFSTAGPIVSIRVCRDMITRRSLGYAYVNFQQPSDAERALDTMNYDAVRNRPLRIMWCQRDPALRKSGVGNVFIKNLDKDIDNKSLYDTFSAFGNILSCKIMTDENGQSKGFGFVHFETKNSADNAIEKVDGMLLAEKKVFVGPFISRAQRGIVDGQRKFTNIFIKNFADELNDEKLRELFSNYGTITSCIVARDPNGHSRGFGFCNMEKPEEAERAVQNLNDTMINERKIYVGRFQKKAERQAELKRKKEVQRQQRAKQSQSVNLYIKNLDDTVDDTRLRDEFGKFGTITSAKIMMENGRSKGFGFVCFSAADEATKAVTEMNGAIIGSKPLYVALAQQREERRHYLANQRQYRATTSQLGPQMSLPFPNAMPGMMSPYAQRRPSPSQMPNFYPPTTMPPFRSNPRWSTPMNAANVRPQTGAQMMNNMQMSQMMAAQHRVSGFGGIPPRSGTPMATRPAPTGQMMPGSGIRSQAGGQQQAVYTQAARNVLPNNQAALLNSIVVAGQQPLTAAALVNATPQEQKQMLGERLFPIIHQMQPELAGKITGMLLEIDNTELLHMLEARDSLKNKVDEAIAVLKAHHDKQAQAAKQAASNSAAQ